ncbi:MAG: TonB-dependent receptor plug domain-containing protein, partial [Woeseiaceae bacterium]|nr:TonB-dependent receptor plug domain-containing protein [Woeseiaceae bacterium]
MSGRGTDSIRQVDPSERPGHNRTQLMSRSVLAILALLTSPPSSGQETETAAAPEAAAPVNRRSVATSDADSTVVYEAEFFAQYKPATASDMLDRIPGLDIGNNEFEAAGDRGLGTGGNLLINGQRIAGKNNAAQDQLDRITADEVQRIEIIRNTSGALNVRGASEVINIVLVAAQSRSSTTVKLVNRLNHDDTFETGGSVSWSKQAGKFQALVDLELRPNYENRDHRELRRGPDGDLLGTLFETN